MTCSRRATCGRPAPPLPCPALRTDAHSPGLRVVDLTAFWAGPFATHYLAAMGADVIKVESTAHPDGIRFLGAFEGDAYWERSMVFAGANPGKRDVTLDLDRVEGTELLWRLIDGADVVIENFTPRVADRFGITWDELHRRWPEPRHGAHARVRARRAVARPRRLRDDDRADLGAGVGDGLRGHPAGAARAVRPDRAACTR